MNLRLVVAGATSRRRGEPKRTSTRHRCGGRRSCRPPLPAEQAAATDPATPDGDSQKDADQPVAAAGNGLPCLLCSLNLPPAPFDIPPPVQVTVPVGVSLGLPAIPLALPAPQLLPPPQLLLPPAPEVPLLPPPSIPLPPPLF